MTALSQLARSSAFRLLLAYLALFIVAAAAGIILFVREAGDVVTRQALQTIAADVRSFRELYQQGGFGLLGEAVAERVRRGGTGLYLLLDADGKTVAGNLRAVPEGFAPERAAAAFRFARAGEGGERRRLGLGSLLGIPSGALLVGRDISEETAHVDRLRRQLLAGLGVVAVIGAAGALLVARAIGRRIAAVTATSARIMKGDLSGRLPIAGRGSELDQLSETLNAMLARIESLVAGLKEVSDNIAHDLKTPLTRLRTRAEAALADPRGAPALRAGLERTIEDADELIRTFNALLAIARLEAGVPGASTEPLDLGAAAAEVAELYEPAAEEAGLALACRSVPGVLVRGERQLIIQAIANLLDNAIKHGRPEAPGTPGRIAVDVAQQGAWAEVSVADSGPGIPAADRERVLKRFVRLEASRTRPGSGLGLSLVAAIAHTHGGSLKLEDNAPGVRARLRLPAASGAGARAKE